MSMSDGNNLSTAIVYAWLQDTQSAIYQAQYHPTSITKEGSLFPTPSPSSSPERSALTVAERSAMISPKRIADHDGDDPQTPKRRQTSTHPDDMPPLSPTQLNTANPINYGSPYKSATPSTESFARSSRSKQSSIASPVKGLGFLMMTQCPVQRSSEISEIPSPGRDLYKDLSRCKSALGVLPRTLKVCLVIECAQHLANRFRRKLSWRLARAMSCTT